MSQLPYPLDPEVEAILQEVAKDPGSVLLRVDRSREIRDLATIEQPVSSRSVCWSKAERHLLDCHREEVAFLLRYLYYVGFVNSERIAALRDLQPKTAFRGIAQDARIIRKHAQREAEHLRTDFPKAKDLNVIERCLGVALDEDSSQLKLATASLRLVPKGVARLYVGQEQLFNGDRISALVTLEKLSRELLNPVERWWALVHFGDACRQEERYASALEAYRRTERIGKPTLDPLIGRLCTAMLAKDSEEFSRAARSLEDGLLDSNAAKKWSAHIATRATHEDWVARPSFRMTLESSIDSAGPLTKVLLNALR